MAVLGKGTHQLAAPLARGLRPDNVNEAANRVAAKQRALWATQHLHALCIPHVQQCTRSSGQINTILVDRDGGVERLLHLGVLHTTNGDTNRSVTEDGVNHEVGRHPGDFIDRSGKRLFDRVGVHSRHGDRHVLHVLFTLLRGDHYLFNF